jgi:OmpA-OmpF porin, OOP family
MVRTIVAAVPALVVALAEGTARGQTVPSIDMRTWRPSTDANASLVLEPSVTPGPWRWNAGAWLQYAEDSVVYRDRGGPAVRPVAHFAGLDLTMGLGIGERVALGLELPVFVFQNGETLPSNFVSGGTVPIAGIGDPAIDGKVTILSNDRGGVHAGFGLAALASVEVPVGNRASFLANGSVAGSLGLLAEYGLEVGAVRAELGYAARADHRTWPLGGLVNVSEFGNSVPWSVGFVVRPKLFATALDPGDCQLWELAAHGSVPAGPTGPFTDGASQLSPALLALDDRIGLGRDRDTRLVVGGEVGLDHAIGVPIFRVVFAIQWAPRTHDKDGDGVPDDRDECPDLPEDRDGVQDADGCPEDDADGDGILDTQDACPLVPGVPSTDPKQNGCPGPAAPPPVPGQPAEPVPSSAPTSPPEGP